MSKYLVSFKAHYNSNGETDDYPGDFLHIDGNAVEDSDILEYKNLPTHPGKEGYCSMIVEYEIGEDWEDIFERALDDCPTVLQYHRVAQ